MISRVFQKTGSGSSSAAGGAGKKRHSAGINSVPEVSSPSCSVSLPSLLEPSAAASADLDCCSYDVVSATSKEHVPCFSTTAPPSFNHNSLSELPPPPLSLGALIHDPSSTSRFPNHGVGLFSFPTLKENLHLPFFSSTVAPPPMHDGADQMFSDGGLSQWPAIENQKICPSELDCIWS